MSRQPANCIGWLATMPTGWPSTRPKPVMMFGANSACVSRNSPSSSTCSMTVCMSYGWFAESGMRVSSSRSSSVDRQVGLLGEGRRLGEVVRRQVRQQRLDVLDGVLLVARHVVRDARGGVVRAGAAQLLEADVLAGDRLDDVRAR